MTVCRLCYHETMPTETFVETMPTETFVETMLTQHKNEALRWEQYYMRYDGSICLERYHTLVATKYFRNSRKILKRMLRQLPRPWIQPYMVNIIASYVGQIKINELYDVISPHHMVSPVAMMRRSSC